MAKKPKQPARPGSPRINNRRAAHDYVIHDRIECGIVLAGSEVKSVRNGKVSLAEGFARVEPRTMEVWLHDVDIAMYENAPAQHVPKHPRKLLLHKREIASLVGRMSVKGMTLIPLAMYYNERGIIKLQIGVASGKGRADKRETLKRREATRDMQRAMTRRRIG